eukprot:scaffold23221_cov40-Tisochrysis_lutea.AAC.2
MTWPFSIVDTHDGMRPGNQSSAVPTPVRQIFALLLLLIGVILAQISQRKPAPAAAAGGAEGGGRNADNAKRGLLALADEEASHEQFLGVAATVLIATLSGFAAVYTEGVLKRGGEHVARRGHGRFVAHSYIWGCTQCA